ncbi:hypothetical protein ABZ078_01615 [Streptomyces sp. NPDC006385]|uniref:hypothetical protein n=1 Tax=Streptomyces sp. NPDC006385 TaxID=3156761 RepID=UPI0033B16736
MWTFLAVATGLPTILLTAALVVVVCFWFLVVAGFTSVGSFDTDMDLRRWGMGGVPVTVAVSSLTVLAWSLSVGGTLALVPLTPPGPATGLPRLIVPVLALLVAWRLTCLFVRPLHRIFPAPPSASPSR